MAIGTVIGIPFKKSGQSWSSYWTTRLSLWSVGRSGLNLTNSLGLNPVIIPALASFDGTTNKMNIGHIFNVRDSFDITIGASWGTGNKRGGFTASNSLNFIFGRIDSTTTKISFTLLDASGNHIIADAGNRDITITNDVYTELRVVKDDALQKVTLYKDGEVVRTVDWNPAFLDNLTEPLGYIFGGQSNNFVAMKPSFLKITGSSNSEFQFTGVGLYDYDITSGNIGTWIGNAPHFEYSENGNQWFLNNGFSVFSKAGQLDEYVPTGGSTTALIVAGYALKANYIGSASNYNYAPSLVDFTTSNLPATDKSNSTHHIATASMSYYDAAHPFRWRNDELSDPRIYSDTYKNVGYKGFMMLQGDVSSSQVINCKEILIASADQIGSAEWKMAQYCTLQDLVVQSGGVPVYDEDNYLTWI